jgi:hypothetical protein
MCRVLIVVRTRVSSVTLRLDENGEHFQRVIHDAMFKTCPNPSKHATTEFHKPLFICVSPDPDRLHQTSPHRGGTTAVKGDAQQFRSIPKDISLELRGIGKIPVHPGAAERTGIVDESDFTIFSGMSTKPGGLDVLDQLLRL